MIGTMKLYGEEGWIIKYFNDHICQKTTIKWLCHIETKQIENYELFYTLGKIYKETNFDGFEKKMIFIIVFVFAKNWRQKQKIHLKYLTFLR